MIFPSEKTQVIRVLKRLAETLSVDSKTTVFAFANKIDNAIGFFTPQTVLQIKTSDGQTRTVTGRENLRSGLLAIKGMGSLEVKFDLQDTVVEIEADKTRATADTTATARGGNPEEFLEIIPLQFSLIKKDGKWLIEKVQTIDTLSPQ